MENIQNSKNLNKNLWIYIFKFLDLSEKIVNLVVCKKFKKFQDISLIELKILKFLLKFMDSNRLLINFDSLFPKYIFNKKDYHFTLM